MGATRTSLSRKVLSAVLVVSFVLPFASVIVPEKAEAGFSNCTVSFLSMFTGSVSKDTATIPVTVPVSVPGKIMPTATTAANSQQSFLKECIEKGLALALAKMILSAITQSIVNWINSGFQGSPSFVTNPDQFFMGIADQVVGEFILGSDLAFLCSPFKLQIQLALAVNYSGGGTGSGRARCSLTQVIDNIEGFYRDFTQGGFSAWVSMTQRPDNNPYGAYLNAQSALSARINGRQAIEFGKLNWGNGFMSFEQCEDGTIVWGGSAQNEEGGVVLREGQSARGGDHGSCEIKTPGKLIEGTLQETTTLPLDQLGVADDLDKIFNALGFQLIKQIMGGVGGLLGASKSSSSYGGRSLVDSLADQARTSASDERTRADSSRSQADSLSNTSISGQDAATRYPISTGKRATQSSYVSGANARSLTDGDTSNAYDDDYTGALTDMQDDPWMKVDLGQTQPISRITIYQRSNPSDRSHSYAQLMFVVQVRDRNDAVVWTSREYPQDFRAAPLDIDVPANISGRYVQIQGTTLGTRMARLEIAELEVYKVNPPTITLRGDSVMTITVGQSYTEPGFTAVDDDENNLTSRVTVTGTVTTSAVGSYTLRYNVTNADGVAAKEVTRQVIVQQQAQQGTYSY